MDKTNVMKILDQKKISYNYFTYDENETNGVEVAKLLNEKVDDVFKTLVTVSNTNKNFVFVIPVKEELDLKKVAKLVNMKSIDMIKQKELQPLTGYIHGGCSPIGMKKLFPTYIDNTCLTKDEICVSAGKCGVQIKIKVNDLIKLTNARTSDLVKTGDNND